MPASASKHLWRGAAIGLIVLGVVASGCASHGGPTAADVKAAHRKGYTHGYDNGLRQGRVEGRGQERGRIQNIAVAAYKLGLSDGRGGALGYTDFTPGDWYAVRLGRGSGHLGITDYLPLDAQQLYAVCPDDPTSICGDSFANFESYAGLPSGDLTSGVSGAHEPDSYLGPPDYPSISGTTEDFGSGNGYVVTCADGTLSDSGGIQGACSYHGGVG